MAVGDLDPSVLQGLLESGKISPQIASKLMMSLDQNKQIDDVAAAAAEQGVGPDQLQSMIPKIIQAESSGNPNAVSPKGAQGLMQVMPATAKEVAGKLGMESYDLKNPEDNAKIGTEYYKQMMQKYGDPALALAAYNAGPGTVDKALKATGGSSFADIAHALPEETQNYVAKITGQPTPTPQPTTIPLPQEAPTPGPSMPAETPQPTPTPALGPATPQPSGFSGHGATDSWEEEPQAKTNIQQAQAIQSQTLANAQAQAQSGDPIGLLDSLSAGEQAGNIALQNAMLTQGEGIVGKAAAESNALTQQAGVYEQQQKELASQGANFAQKRQAVEAQTQADMDRYRQKVIEFGNASIDPNHLFKSQSTFSTILLGVGSIVQALAGNTQAGLKLIDDAIDKDIRIQKANIDLKGDNLKQEQSLMAANLAMTRNVEAAEAQTRAQMLAQTEAQVKVIAAKSGSEIAKQNAAIAVGVLQQKQAELAMKYQAKQSEVNALEALFGGQTAPLTPYQQVLRKLAANPKISPRILTGLNGEEVGLSKSDKMTGDFQSALQYRQEIIRDVDRLQELYKDGQPVTMNGAKWNEMNALVNNLKTKVVQAQDRGLRGFSSVIKPALETELPSNLFASNPLTAAGQSIRRGVWSDEVPGMLKRFKDKYGRMLLDSAQATMSSASPEFLQWVRAQKLQAGELPGAKKVQ